MYEFIVYEYIMEAISTCNVFLMKVLIAQNEMYFVFSELGINFDHIIQKVNAAQIILSHYIPTISISPSFFLSLLCIIFLSISQSSS